MKTCTKCKKEGQFSKNKNMADGFHKWCKVCLREGKIRSYLKNKEHYNSKSHDYYKANGNQVRQMNARWRKENSDKMSGYIQKYRSSEKGKTARNNDNLRRYESGYRKAWNHIRRKGVENATPIWVNKKELVEIFKNRPEGYHVDHIVPLRGKNVCGLNVPWNLQYLTASENIRKSNKS